MANDTIRARKTAGRGEERAVMSQQGVRVGERKQARTLSEVVDLIFLDVFNRYLS
jgi:hypothetical protein